MIEIELWLYGPLARYAGEADVGSHACLHKQLPVGTTLKDLLDELGMPVEEKGITFINRKLSGMPGLTADLKRELADGDRVAIFHDKSMWPYQYRHQAASTPELEEELRDRDGGLHHAYE